MHSGKYLPTLDGWRAVAILIVVYSHASDSLGTALGLSGMNGMHALGLFGVQIFFGLSGFLITSRLVADEVKHGRISLASFYIRRAFRIMPASLALLATVGLLALWGVLPVSFDRWVSTVLFFANYSTAERTWYLGHFWSLAVEEHFYFVWPLAFLTIRTGQGRIRFALATALGVALWRAIDLKFGISGASSERFWGRTDIQADAIAWGVVVALLYSDSTWKAKLNTLLQRPASVPTLTSLLALSFVLPELNWKLGLILLTLKSIAIPLLILGVMLSKGTPWFNLLESRVFRTVGEMSYSLYLWQQLFLVWSSSMVLAMAPLQSFPLNLLAAIGCAWLSLHLIEKPMINFGRNLADRHARHIRSDA